MKLIKLSILVILFPWALCHAQDDQPYLIGVDDRLMISFWQKPELDSEVRVGEDGQITLPVIGIIRAAGLSTAQLAKNVVEQMAFYNPGISQATVVVTEYNSQTVVLTGEVNKPGQYHFEQIPSLLDIIREAGGATSSADLSAVKILRQEDSKVETIKVDLLKYIRKGELADLPPLKAKDMIDIPVSPYGMAAETLGDQTLGGRNIFYIYGAVNSPGIKTLSEGMGLLDAIVVAGGTTGAADTKNVRVLIRDPQYSIVLKFNLDEYTETGRPSRYDLRPEDTIVIPFSRQRGLWSRLPELIVPGLVVGVITAMIYRETF